MVGQNNAGKTALLEAITLQLGDIQHRSLVTHPVVGAVVAQPSIAVIEVAFADGEWQGLVADSGGHFILTANSGSHQIAMEHLRRARDPELRIRIKHSPRLGRTTEVVGYGGNGNATHFNLTRPTLHPEPANGGQNRSLSDVLAEAVSGRIYLFRAERFRVGEGPFGHRSVLETNAQNLPEVLNSLQANREAHRRFNELVQRVLPQVRWVSVQSRENNMLRVLVWSIDPASERVDLAVPLNESGTGVGQVLAILYVAALSTRSGIIAIDEPQSFLHPGAVRALIEILREHSQHQFVITTHSPAALTAATPETILNVQIKDGVSSVTALRIEESKATRLLLADLGVRMEDVFGFEHVLWVEGRTEEVCFPLILKQLAPRPLARTAILGLVATGDLEGRHRELAFEIYTRLSEGSVLLPPAVAFIFDRERRTDSRIRDMTDQRAGKVRFLPRRMFENYLLDRDAIASVTSAIEGFGSVTAEQVQQWFERRKWDADLFQPGGLPAERNEGTWLENVSGANVLGKVFGELSETRVSYDKVKHGQALTRWLLEQKPETLQQLADFVAAPLPTV